MGRLNQGSSPYLLGHSAGAKSVTGTLNETPLGTFIVPGNVMGANGAIQIWHSWSFTNSVNQKTLFIRLNSLSNPAIFNTTSISLANLSNGTQLSIVANQNAANAQRASNLIGGFAFTATSPVSDTVDTTKDFTVFLSAQLANAGETITLQYYYAVLIPTD